MKPADIIVFVPPGTKVQYCESDLVTEPIAVRRAVFDVAPRNAFSAEFDMRLTGLPVYDAERWTAEWLKGASAT